MIGHFAVCGLNWRYQYTYIRALYTQESENGKGTEKRGKTTAKTI